MSDHFCIEDMKTKLNANFDQSLAELFNFRKGRISGYGLRVVITEKTKNGKDRKKKTWIKLNYCPFCGESLRESEE